MNTKQLALDNMIFMTLTGSKMYGTNVEGSDEDLRGIFMPTPEMMMSFSDDGQFDKFEGMDMVVYDLRKAILLMGQCNPNMVELLFIHPKYWKRTSSVWNAILDNKHLFLSKEAGTKAIGFAKTQIGRMEGHKRWLDDPPDHAPTRTEYNLPEGASAGVNSKELGMLLQLGEKFIKDEWLEIARNEKRFHNAVNVWDQYQKWVKDRNPARAELEAKFGYDTKHAMHVVRILRQALELLETGNMHPDRRGIDADLLVSIRNGAWTHQQVIDEFDRLRLEINVAMAFSALPEKTDIKVLEQFNIRLMKEYHEQKDVPSKLDIWKMEQ